MITHAVLSLNHLDFDARIDRLGLLRVGPACYSQGGLDATVTGTDLELGHLGADSFLGGDMRLDLAAARAAIVSRIGTPSGLSVEEAAWGIHDLVINVVMDRAASARGDMAAIGTAFEMTYRRLFARIEDDVALAG